MEEVEEKTLRSENDCVPSGLKFLKISRYIWIRSGLSQAVKIDIKILYIYKINKFLESEGETFLYRIMNESTSKMFHRAMNANSESF